MKGRAAQGSRFASAGGDGIGGLLSLPHCLDPGQVVPLSSAQGSTDQGREEPQRAAWFHSDTHVQPGAIRRLRDTSLRARDQTARLTYGLPDVRTVEGDELDAHGVALDPFPVELGSEIDGSGRELLDAPGLRVPLGSRVRFVQ